LSGYTAALRTRNLTGDKTSKFTLSSAMSSSPFLEASCLAGMPGSGSAQQGMAPGDGTSGVTMLLHGKCRPAGGRMKTVQVEKTAAPGDSQV
jgi:hypothetical protein